MSKTPEYKEMISRHRQENKDLIALTQKMKCSVPKGDKKRKKDVMAEIAIMTSNLDLKHEKECEDFEAHHASTSKDSNEIDLKAGDAAAEATQNAVDDIKVSCDVDTACSNPIPKLSRAQKRRNKKAEIEKSREMAIKLQEIENMYGERSLEGPLITSKLADINLHLHEIPSDGSCLFKAIEHQLLVWNLKKRSAEDLRRLTSEHLMEYREKYQSYLTNPQTRDLYTDAEYEAYCEKIKDPSVWGGHVELEALSKICGKPIQVIQANGPTIFTGHLTGLPMLTISYHKHQYGLGAHYNSSRPF